MEALHLIRLFWGVGFPLHKPYPYSLYRCFIPPFWVPFEIFGDKSPWKPDMKTDLSNAFIGALRFSPSKDIQLRFLVLPTIDVPQVSNEKKGPWLFNVYI